MKLSTGKSNWLDSWKNPPAYPVLEQDIEVDVLVVGGGMAGAQAAWELVKRGMRIAIVDKREIAGGSSSANTGLIQFSNDKSLKECIKTFGEDKGVRFYKLCQESVARLEGICGELEMDPQFKSRDSLYLASSATDVPALHEEYMLLKQHGFQVSWMGAADIGGSFPFSKPAAIYSKGDAEVNPYRLVHSLIYSLSCKGTPVYQHTKIKSFEDHGDYLNVITDTGSKIKAQHVIVATGYETQSIHPIPQAVIASTYAIATQPLDGFPDWPDRCLIWETARPYLYVRTTFDNRIVAGGMDEDITDEQQRDKLLPEKTDALVAAVQKLFPQYGELRADYNWAATFGETHDGLPLIGGLEEFPRCFFSMGYGGNGTAYSIFAAQIIADLIEKGSNPDAEMFRVDRPDRGDDPDL